MNFTIEVTENCPLECVHCSTRAGPGKDYFMKLGDYQKYTAGLSGGDTVRISGGEPFHHPNLPEFLEYSKAAGVGKTEILSSGNFHGDQIPRELIANCLPHLDEVMFSVYGSSESHDKICGVDGARNNLEQSVWSCLDYGIPIKFETLAMPGVRLDEIFDYMQSLNYDTSLKIMRLVNQGRANGIPRFDESEIEAFKELALEGGKERGINVRLSCSLTDKCLASSRKSALVITPEGPRFISCSSQKYSDQRPFGCRD